MRIPVTYAEAKARYPAAVEEIIQKLRSGKSKEKNSAPDKLDWFFDWGIVLPSCRFEDILKGIKEEAGPVKDRIRCSLFASKGRWWKFSEHILPIPQEIIDIEEQGEKEHQEKKKKYAELPEEEKQARMQETLNQLRGTPGFMEITVPISD